ncbi:hypothetical protein [Thermus sp.]|uniref:hypothetical protein n=1 Tax=Thermus sp. TaxID=275 RepID=UPI00307EFFA6
MRPYLRYGLAGGLLLLALLLPELRPPLLLLSGLVLLLFRPAACPLDAREGKEKT